MENVLAAMRNKFCQEDCIIENKRNDVLTPMRNSFCDRSTSKTHTKLKKQSGNDNKQTKNPEIPELMMKVKEEPISEDKAYENEKEEENKPTETPMDIIKTEDFVVEEWIDYQIDNSCSNGLPDFKNEISSVPHYEVEENDGIFEVDPLSLENEKVGVKQNEDNDDEEEDECHDDIDKDEEHISDPK
ncbi:unnamed protein product, partial [Meganyctiphanes norvegica]